LASLHLTPQEIGDSAKRLAPEVLEDEGVIFTDPQAATSPLRFYRVRSP
jgi:hypothetical protein